MMRKKYSHHLFPTNPEYVLPILKDMPQLKEFFNEKYYQAWSKSLNSPKKVYPFDDYEFKIKPYEHQKVAMSFARQLPRCALFMETGTGKTMTSLNVAEMRIKAGIVKKVLVIAPASVLKTGWYADLKKFTNMTGVILHPQKNFSCICPVCFRRFLKRSTHAKHEHKFPFPEEMEWRKHKTFEERLYNIDADVYITSHQLARINKKHLINKGFDMVILDESTILKNPTSKQAKELIEIGWASKFGIILTGTPVTGNIEDLWGQMSFVDYCLDFEYKEFIAKNFWVHHKHNWMKKPLSGSVERIMETVKKRALFIEKDECLDLPPLVTMVREVDMTSKIKSAYKIFEKDLVLRLEDKTFLGQTVLTEILRLHQITNGFLTDPETGEVSIIDKSQKISETLNILEQTNTKTKKKAIIWASYRQDFKNLKEALKEYNPAIINGETSNIEKEIEKFVNDDSCRVAVCHAKSVKYGHTWNFATTTIHYSYTYDVEDFWQSLARNYRIGQTEKVSHFVLISSEIEDIIYHALSNKEDFAENALNWLRK